MKKQFVLSSTRKTLTRFGFATLLFLNTATAFAGGGKGDDPFINIRHTGTVENRAHFQVDLVNDNDEAFLLSIQDQNGTFLYKEKITSKTFTKRFQFEQEELEASKLVFSITGLKSKKTQTFEVNSAVRTVQDVTVTRL